MNCIDRTDHRPKPRKSRLPGDLAIWFFILAEMLAFAVFFAAYAFARASHVENSTCTSRRWTSTPARSIPCC